MIWFVLQNQRKFSNKCVHRHKQNSFSLCVIQFILYNMQKHHIKSIILRVSSSSTVSNKRFLSLRSLCIIQENDNPIKQTRSLFQKGEPCGFWCRTRCSSKSSFLLRCHCVVWKTSNENIIVVSLLV
jgi:hypothetical protein